MREMDPAEKIDAGRESFDKNLIGMERELQPRFEKTTYRRQKIFQMPPVLMHDYEVVGITHAVADFQSPFEKLVEFVHINIHEELTREIPERQTGTRLILCVETAYDFGQQPENIAVVETPSQNIFQYFMIDAREELPDIAFEDPSSSRVVARNNSHVLIQPIHGAVGALVEAAGI